MSLPPISIGIPLGSAFSHPACVAQSLGPNRAASSHPACVTEGFGPLSHSTTLWPISPLWTVKSSTIRPHTGLRQAPRWYWGTSTDPNQRRRCPPVPTPSQDLPATQHGRIPQSTPPRFGPFLTEGRAIERNEAGRYPAGHWTSSLLSWRFGLPLTDRPSAGRPVWTFRVCGFAAQGSSTAVLSGKTVTKSD